MSPDTFNATMGESHLVLLCLMCVVGIKTEQKMAEKKEAEGGHQSIDDMENPVRKK